VCGGVDRVGACLTDTAKSVGNRVSNLDDWVFHHADHDRQSLLDQGVENLLIRSLHDGTECRDSGISVMPILGAKVLLNELENCGNDNTTDGLGPELQTLVSSARDVVLIVSSILVLLGQ
jgi:hypothetical protein